MIKKFAISRKIICQTIIVILTLNQTETFFNMYSERKNTMSSDTLPDSGGRVKNGGWGANPDPNNWNIVPMKDDPSLFKVVDNNKVNVADRFQNKESAEKFIDFYKSKQAECGDGKVFNYITNQCEDKISRTGKTIYKPTGETVDQIENHVQNIGCSGHRSNSRRGDCKVDFINQEATVTVQFTNDCTCGDELTIKHWGPGHSDGNCCWEIGCVNQSGDVGRMGEGPHPSASSPKPTSEIKNIGSIAGQKIGVKSIVWKIDGPSMKGHHEMWVDNTATGNNWQKVSEWDFDQWGNNQKTNKIAPFGRLTVEFRCDCDGATFSDLSVDEIVPGVLA